jgi:uncharacterized protein
VPDVTPIAGDGIEVRGGRLGRGVFATRRFVEGDTVEVCPTLEIADSESVGKLGDYVFGTEDEKVVLLILGFGMLYNHSGDANVEYVQDAPDTITYVALRDIEAGEELTISYGDEWWEGRGIVPD